jgi:phage baseplate assembly protein W
MGRSILMGTAISLPFSFNTSGAINTNNLDSKQWADRVFGAIFTRLGERPMRPNYGSIAADALFEPEGSVVDFVQQTVTSAFGEFLPELKLLRVEIEKDSVEGLNELVLTVSVEYRLPNKQVEIITTKIGSFTRAGELIEEIE